MRKSKEGESGKIIRNDSMLCKRVIFFLSIYCLTFLLIILKIDLKSLITYDNKQKASLNDYLYSNEQESGSIEDMLYSFRKQHNDSPAVLTAYLEKVDQDEWEINPLPMRKNAKSNLLKEIEYKGLNSCSRLTSQWPVDDYPDDDPFLPWIHDVFPSADGSVINFIAENKRRCHAGQKSEELRNLSVHMQPQVSLFQHVPIKRVNDTRYRLASHEDADVDGMQTRFICGFKPTMEETTSTFQVDYECATYRKLFHRERVMFNKKNNHHNNV